MDTTDDNLTALTSERIAELVEMLEYDHATESWRYTGPLDEGRALADRDGYSAIAKNQHDLYSVYLGPEPDPTWETCFSYGHAADEDTAWRFALGAEFVAGDRVPPQAAA